MMNPQLKNHILKFAKPTKEDLFAFEEALEFKEIKNKDYLVKEGQFCKHKYFILQGCFRFFFINEKGIEKTVNFGIEEWWITDYDSLGTKISHIFLFKLLKTQKY